jgi:hypothetical protein
MPTEYDGSQAMPLTPQGRCVTVRKLSKRYMQMLMTVGLEMAVLFGVSFLGIFWIVAISAPSRAAFLQDWLGFWAKVFSSTELWPLWVTAATGCAAIVLVPIHLRHILAKRSRRGS